MMIRDLVRCIPQLGDVGVEIELEADNIPRRDRIPETWKLEQDPSLRGESGEFVLRKPERIADLPAVLESLGECLRRHKTVARPTYRAGIHVHVNVQDLTPVQLINFICAYFMLEEVLLRFCDKSRLGNHFCLRLSDASYPLDKLVDFITKEDLNELDTEDLRYASLNVTSLFKYGSIEFRALESTLDFARIQTWAGMLVRLRDYAKTFGKPTDLLGQASVMGFEEIVPVMLGEFYPHFRQWAKEPLVRQGIRNIQYAIYSRDWEELNMNIFKAKSLF